jgi:hypothetical protein
VELLNKGVVFATDILSLCIGNNNHTEWQLFTQKRDEKNQLTMEFCLCTTKIEFFFIHCMIGFYANHTKTEATSVRKACQASDKRVNFVAPFPSLESDGSFVVYFTPYEITPITGVFYDYVMSDAN